MMRGLFVTGTGTGVGKTFVTARLAELAVASGHRVFAFKPIETGCRFVDGLLVGEDQERLARAAGNWQRGELRNLYCFERPLAPWAAARAEHRTIDLALVDSAFEKGRARADVTLVEGAGGWRVPLAMTSTAVIDMAALAQRLELPVLIVATAGLGTINHALLTIEAVQRDGCELVGVVLSRRPDDDAEFANENAEAIRSRAGCRVEVSDLLDVSWLS